MRVSSPALTQVLAILVAGASVGCKTVADNSALHSAEVKAIQCVPGATFKGTCQVTELVGRQGVTTEVARESFAVEIAEVRFGIPGATRDAHTNADFYKKTGIIEELKVVDALDLYSRQGCLAEISGGVFGEGFTPRVTLRVLFNVADDAHSGYAEVSDYRSGKPMLVTLGLKCDWQ